MCGIFGIVNNKNLDFEKFSDSVNLLKHRGPDSTNIITWNNCYIGHLLLALRANPDLSKQPIQNERYILAFNGQIYNIKEICHKYNLEYNEFYPDTIYLFELINKHGVSSLRFVNGMYAIAILDKEKNLLHITRDQSGQKNLYYYIDHTSNTVAFSSEIKALTAIYSPSPSFSAIDIALSYGYNPGYETVFKNINKLLPGEFLTLNILNGTMNSVINSFEPIISQVKNCEYNSIKHEIISHFDSTRKIGINLSGGVDSSIIAYELSMADLDYEIFTTRFNNASNEYNEEYEIAKYYAAKLGRKFNTVEFSVDDYLNNLYQSYAIIEEPNYNRSIPLYYHTSNTISNNSSDTKVIFSGDGGDELFYGYSHYRKHLKYDYMIKLLGKKAVNLLLKLKKSNYTNITDYDFFYHQLRGLENKKYINLYKNIEDKNLLPNLLMRDRLMWLANENFIRSDKIYMSNSIELRSPLASQNLRYIVDKSINYTSNFKYGYNKYALRKFYFDKIPDLIIKRRKKVGWASPIDEWYNSKIYSAYNDFLPSGKNYIDWPEVKNKYLFKDKPPNKRFYIYLSLAIIAREYNIQI